MHKDNIQQEPNLYDPEKPEAFLYDPELFAKAYSELFDDEDEANASQSKLRLRSNQSPTGT